MISRVPLETVAVVNPRVPKKADESQDVTFLAMSSVSEDGQLLDSEMKSFSEVKKGYTYFERGDVLLAKITPCFENGKAIYLEDMPHQIGFGSTEFHVIRPDPEKLDGRYLFYLLWNPAFRFVGERNMTGSAGQKRVPVDFLKRTEIPLPPLEEQKRIAAILDKADAIRRKRQQAIELADQFLRAVFLDMFGDPDANTKGWDEPLLKDVADIRSGVTKGKKIDPSTAVTLPYMRVANVQDGYLDLSDVQDITVSPKDAEKCQLVTGDVLLTEGGDPDKLGRGYVWGGEIEHCIHQNHIFSVRAKDTDEVNPVFLSAVIGSTRGKRYFLKVGKQTTGIATINKTVLSEFPLILPPKKKQDEYVRIVEKISGLKTRHANSTIGLFESLSSHAFAGAL